MPNDGVPTPSNIDRDGAASPARDALRSKLDTTMTLGKKKSWFGGVRDSISKGTAHAKGFVGGAKGAEGRSSRPEVQENGARTHRIADEEASIADTSTSGDDDFVMPVRPSCADKQKTLTPKNAMTSLRQHIHSGSQEKHKRGPLANSTGSGGNEVRGAKTLAGNYSEEADKIVKDHSRKSSVARSMIGSLRALSRRSTLSKAASPPKGSEDSKNNINRDFLSLGKEPAAIPLPSSPIPIPTLPALHLDLGVPALMSDTFLHPPTLEDRQERIAFTDPAMQMPEKVPTYYTRLPGGGPKDLRALSDSVKNSPLFPPELLYMPVDDFGFSPPGRSVTPIPGTNIALELDGTSDGTLVFERGVEDQDKAKKQQSKTLKTMASIDALAREAYGSSPASGPDSTNIEASSIGEDPIVRKVSAISTDVDCPFRSKTTPQCDETQVVTKLPEREDTLTDAIITAAGDDEELWSQIQAGLPEARSFAGAHANSLDVLLDRSNGRGSSRSSSHTASSDCGNALGEGAADHTRKSLGSEQAIWNAGTFLLAASRSDSGVDDEQPAHSNHGSSTAPRYQRFSRVNSLSARRSQPGIQQSADMGDLFWKFNEKEWMKSSGRYNTGAESLDTSPNVSSDHTSLEKLPAQKGKANLELICSPPTMGDALEFHLQRSDRNMRHNAIGNMPVKIEERGALGPKMPEQPDEFSPLSLEDAMLTPSTLRSDLNVITEDLVLPDYNNHEETYCRQRGSEKRKTYSPGKEEDEDWKEVIQQERSHLKLSSDSIDAELQGDLAESYIFQAAIAGVDFDASSPTLPESGTQREDDISSSTHHGTCSADRMRHPGEDGYTRLESSPLPLQLRKDSLMNVEDRSEDGSEGHDYTFKGYNDRSKVEDSLDDCLNLFQSYNQLQRGSAMDTDAPVRSYLLEHEEGTMRKVRGPDVEFGDQIDKEMGGTLPTSGDAGRVSRKSQSPEDQMTSQPMKKMPARYRSQKGRD